MTDAVPHPSAQPAGSTLIVALVFLATGLAVAAAILGLAVSASRIGARALARASAFHLAEAGAHEQRWRLAHRPDDAAGRSEPRVLAFRDATGRASGAVTIRADGPDPCTGQTAITAVGSPAAHPSSTRTVTVRYGQPSLAAYAFLTNATLSFAGGDDDGVDGRIHANSGIRMDAEQNAVASSAVATYTCGTRQGCAAAGEERTGIWGFGSGGVRGLWRFPVPAVSFAAITADLRALRDAAAQYGGTVLPPSGAYGYYLKFKSNGTVDVHRVTRLQRPVWSYDGTRWTYESHDLAGIPALDRTITLPQDTCGFGNLIVVEDDVWVDGVAGGRVTVVARFPPEATTRQARVYLNGSLTLRDPQRDAVGIIAQGDIRFPLVLPDAVSVSGILIAQHGKIFRPYYPPESYRPWHLRQELHLTGSLITNGTAATAWVDRNGTVISGFRTATNTFDARYVLDPPPFIPARSESVFLQWNEK